MSLLRRTIVSAVSLTLSSYAPSQRLNQEDFVQDAYLRLCRDNYRAFRGIPVSDPRIISAIARATAVTATLDALRAASAEKRSGGLAAVPLDDPSAEAGAATRTDHLLERRMLINRIDELIPEICPPDNLARDRRIFWLYYRSGCTVPEIATLLGNALSVKGIESVLQRLKESLKIRLTLGKDSSSQLRLAKGKRIGL